MTELNAVQQKQKIICRNEKCKGWSVIILNYYIWQNKHFKSCSDATLYAKVLCNSDVRSLKTAQCSVKNLVRQSCQLSLWLWEHSLYSLQQTKTISSKTKKHLMTTIYYNHKFCISGNHNHPCITFHAKNIHKKH